MWAEKKEPLAIYFSSWCGLLAPRPLRSRLPSVHPPRAERQAPWSGRRAIAERRSGLRSTAAPGQAFSRFDAVRGFATRLAPLDEAVGDLPTEGGVLIICASYNGAPPDNATQFVKWLEGGLAKDALSGVRYAVFGCGNKDWAATYQHVPRLIDQKLTEAGARNVFERGEGDARSGDLEGQFEAWSAKLRPVAAKELGITTGFDRMAAQIKDQLGGEKPKVVFQFECGTRGKMMFWEQEKLQLQKRFRQSLDPDAPRAGFYTVGEIGPVEEHNLRHLYTSVVLALS